MCESTDVVEPVSDATALSAALERVRVERRECLTQGEPLPLGTCLRSHGYIGIAGPDEAGKSLFAGLLANELKLSPTAAIGEISDVLIEWEARRVVDSQPRHASGFELKDMIALFRRDRATKEIRNHLRATGNLQRCICPGAAIDKLIDSGKRIICGLREKCEIDYLYQYVRGENWIIHISREPFELIAGRPVRILQYQNTSIEDLKKHAADAAWMIKR